MYYPESRKYIIENTPCAFCSAPAHHAIDIEFFRMRFITEGTEQWKYSNVLCCNRCKNRHSLISNPVNVFYLWGLFFIGMVIFYTMHQSSMSGGSFILIQLFSLMFIGLSFFSMHRIIYRKRVDTWFNKYTTSVYQTQIKEKNFEDQVKDTLAIILEPASFPGSITFILLLLPLPFMITLWDNFVGILGWIPFLIEILFLFLCLCLCLAFFDDRSLRRFCNLFELWFPQDNPKRELALKILSEDANPNHLQKLRILFKRGIGTQALIDRCQELLRQQILRSEQERMKKKAHR